MGKGQTGDTSPIGAAGHQRVGSSNEWDPLESVVVGRLDGAAAQTPAIPASKTIADLEGLAGLLAAEGVGIQRPEPTRLEGSVETADWSGPCFSSACPRDGVLIIGDEILEAPLPWRTRVYDNDGLRTLFLESFRAGARWTTAPRPELKDALYEKPQGAWLDDIRPALFTTEFEPVLCAADVVRCNENLYALRTAGTNRRGIAWLRRHLQGIRDVHEIHPRRPVAATLDTLLLPLAPDRILIREEAIDPDHLPASLRDSEILCAPSKSPAALNVLSLDPERVLVEAHEREMIDALRAWGFTPIPVPLPGYGALGGSIRRATLDVRRRSTSDREAPRSQEPKRSAP